VFRQGTEHRGQRRDLLATKALEILVDDAGAAFLAAHEQLEKDEAAIWAGGSDASEELTRPPDGGPPVVGVQQPRIWA
jgi:hypothetical protein